MKRFGAGRFVLIFAAMLGIVIAAAANAQKSEDAGAQETVLPAEISGVNNASKTSDGNVYFGGQPSAESIEVLKQLGVKVVINLRRPEETTALGFDEKAMVETAGMQYVSVPMGSELPTAEALKPVLEKLGTADEERVFLHCASSNRVGAVWAVFEGTTGGKSVDDAIAEGKKAGLKAPALEEGARARIADGAGK